MQIKSKSGRIFDLPSPEEVAKIQTEIAADPDTSELPDDVLKQLRPVGRPKAAVTKTCIDAVLKNELNSQR